MIGWSGRMAADVGTAITNGTLDEDLDRLAAVISHRAKILSGCLVCPMCGELMEGEDGRLVSHEHDEFIITPKPKLG